MTIKAAVKRTVVTHKTVRTVEIEMSAVEVLALAVFRAGGHSQLAKMLGVTRNTITYWLTIKFCIPARHIPKASALLDIPAIAFYPDENSTDNPPTNA